jgi:putative transposase
MQILKYKYRIYPNNEQVSKLNQICGIQRAVWNNFLAEEMDRYENDGKFNFLHQNSKWLTELKDYVPWLNKSPAVSLQQTLRYLDSAIKQSFKKGSSKKGFPKFKKKRNNNGSFSLTMTSIKANIKGEQFYIPKVGLVNWKCHREVPNEFKSIQVKQEAGRWFVVLTTKKAKIPKRSINSSIGIDLNSKEYVIFNGKQQERFDVPKPLRENQTKMKVLQQLFARSKKGSNNRRKIQYKIQRLHQYMANVRSDFFHKLSHYLVTKYDLICIEDLDVKGIQVKMGKVIQDNMFGAFRQMIEYKAELYGATTSVISRWYPSSQTCSSCGGIQKMPLNLRTYNCKNCNFELDRDLNSAINIRRAGTARIAFGDETPIEQAIVFGQLVNIYEEGSH